ncbi:hypothetical protein ACPF8X_39945 [Streptomyces sp. G35A]
MARDLDLILGQTAYGRGQETAILDASKGGQFGYSNNLAEWLSDQAYVRGNLIPFVLRMPGFFDLMPDAAKYRGITKELFERRARVIEGFNAGLKVDVDEHAFGGAGEMMQEPTNVTRARTEPVFTWQEIYGNAIQRFLMTWIRYGIMDPDTKFALMSTIDGQRPDDRLADWYTMTMAFVEPDPTHRKVIKSWIVTNMFPLETGEIIGKRDLTAAQEMVTLTIPFAGIATSNLGATKLAQSLLDSMDLTGADPYLVPAFMEGPESNVVAERGYKDQVAKMGAERLTDGPTS